MQVVRLVDRSMLPVASELHGPFYVAEQDGFAAIRPGCPCQRTGLILEVCAAIKINSVRNAKVQRVCSCIVEPGQPPRLSLKNPPVGWVQTANKAVKFRSGHGRGPWHCRIPPKGDKGLRQRQSGETFFGQVPNYARELG